MNAPRELSSRSRAQDAIATTALNALQADEVRRTRALLIGELVTVASVGVLAAVSPGSERFKPWVVALSALSVVLLAVGAAQKTYSTKRLLAAHASVIPFVILAYTYLGVWSFFAAGSAVGVFVFAMGSSRRFALLSYLLMASVPAVGMFGLALGFIRPTGLVRPLPMAPVVQLGFLLYLQLYFAAMYWLGRETRRSQLLAISELEAALRKVDEQDALLDEAQRDLHRLEAGGRGRWSGAQIGPWRLGNLLGRGGMGEVYAAVHADAGTEAAVKLLALEVEESPDSVRRFRREAEILTRLRHPGIVQLYEVGEVHGVPYLAMERLDGESLAVVLRRERKLEPKQVSEMLRSIAEALDHALDASVVHRDLKPQNLFRIQATGRWKILDFGISQLGGGATITHGQALGTPGYMAPEQIRGGIVDQRADVFALSAVLYRCMTGVPAFAGDQVRILYDVAHIQPRRPSVARDVELVLALGLAKAPEERFANASALADAFDLAVANRLDPATRARAEALLARHPWGGFDADDDLTERLSSRK